MLLVYKCNSEAIIPSYSTEKAACFDLHACLPEGTKVSAKISTFNDATREIVELDATFDITSDKKLVIPPHARVLIPTGLKLKIPNQCSVRLHPRSGLAYKHGITLANCEGVIDEDYYGELYIAVLNNSDCSFTVHHSDRICQAEIVKDERYSILETFEEPKKVSNREGGFGSTGV